MFPTSTGSPLLTTFNYSTVQYYKAHFYGAKVNSRTVRIAAYPQDYDTLVCGTPDQRSSSGLAFFLACTWIMPSLKSS